MSTPLLPTYTDHRLPLATVTIQGTEYVQLTQSVGSHGSGASVGVSKDGALRADIWADHGTQYAVIDNPAEAYECLTAIITGDVTILRWYLQREIEERNAED